MPQLKQKTVGNGSDKQTVVLKKLKNTMPRGGEWMYVVEDKDTRTQFGDPFTNKREAKKAFRDTVREIEKGLASRGSSGKSKDMGLGSTDDLYEPFDDDSLF